MLRTFVAFLCMCCVAPVHAKLGETVPEQSSDHEYIALLRYTQPEPENSVWTMTVGRAKVVGSVLTATPPSPVTTPLAKQTPTPPASAANGQNLNFAIPADYVTTLQKKQTELRPFKGVPRAKPQRTLLDHLGGQQPPVGVTGEMLTYDGMLQTGAFSFSLRNELRENVANIYGILIFYDPRGEPIDIYRINYQGLVPPGMAKRLKGQVDESVERLNCPKAASYPELPPRSPEGKAEFRILDFQSPESRRSSTQALVTA